MERCDWANSCELLKKYHDEEWGVPVHDDKKHFEFLLLESAQCGLSWLTILKRREFYRTVYDGFDPAKIAGYGSEKVESLLKDPGIIRNRKKVEASVVNASKFLEIQKEFGSFDSYLWGFVHGKPIVNSRRSLSEIPAVSPLSDAVAEDLRKRGFRFLGSVTVYAHLQAVGIVNDHVDSCFRKNCSF